MDLLRGSSHNHSLHFCIFLELPFRNPNFKVSFYRFELRNFDFSLTSRLEKMLIEAILGAGHTRASGKVGELEKPVEPRIGSWDIVPVKMDENAENFNVKL